jgi:hypothetical protein
MTTTATHNGHATTPERVLFVAFELSEKTWKLGCTTGHGQKPRERGISACHQTRLLQEVAQAKKRFGLPATAPGVRCYEAGREGFWLHRFLQAQGITKHGVFLPSPQIYAARHIWGVGQKTPDCAPLRVGSIQTTRLDASRRRSAASVAHPDNMRSSRSYSLRIRDLPQSRTRPPSYNSAAGWSRWYRPRAART